MLGYNNYQEADRAFRKYSSRENIYRPIRKFGWPIAVVAGIFTAALSDLMPEDLWIQRGIIAAPILAMGVAQLLALQNKKKLREADIAAENLY